MSRIDASGIRKAFEMAKAMKDPINLSIGLPDFDVPTRSRTAAIEAIERRPQRVHGHPGHPRAAGEAPGGDRRAVRPRRPRGPGHLAGPAAGLMLADAASWSTRATR